MDIQTTGQPLENRRFSAPEHETGESLENHRFLHASIRHVKNL
jgi:hypothetical protein